MRGVGRGASGCHRASPGAGAQGGSRRRRRPHGPGADRRPFDSPGASGCRGRVWLPGPCRAEGGRT
eukprot:6971049-Lingulodinium_polyedra.AAC.1